MSDTLILSNSYFLTLFSNSVDFCGGGMNIVLANLYSDVLLDVLHKLVRYQQAR